MKSSEVYQVLKSIRATRGRNAKMTIMAANPGIQKILCVTYDPFRHFFVKPPNPEWAPSDLGQDFSKDTSMLLTQLSNRTLSGTAARVAISKHMRTLNHESSMLLTHILNKSWDCGISTKTINTVWPGLIPVHAIQLAELYNENKASWPMLTSPKLDGLRCTFRRGKLLSRYGTEFQGLDHLLKVLEPYNGCFELDGELMVPGKLFDEISGTIRSFRPTDNVVYHVFDMPGESDLQNRLHNLRSVVIMLNTPTIQLVPHMLVESPEQAEFYNAQFMEEGYEGSVLKNPYAPYIDGRSRDWMKIKAVETADCIVEDVYEGEGQFANAAGGLVVRYNGVDTRVGGGLSNMQRREWWDDKWLIVGKVVEVAYQNLTPQGRLRHPRLVHVRGDRRV